MTTVTVKRNNLRHATRKVRFVLDMIRKKRAVAALDMLEYLNMGPAKEVQTLLKSGIAAAKQKELNEDLLVISMAKADEGQALKRRWLRNRGQATQIKKGTSHITITLGEATAKTDTPKKAKE